MEEKSKRSKSATKKSQIKVASSKKDDIKKADTMLVEPKKYLYAAIAFIGIILISLYAISWYRVKRDEKLMTSYLISTNTIMASVNDLASLKDIMQEAPESYFIFLGSTNDEYTYNLEKDLKKEIDKYKLNDMFYYVDVTNIKKNNEKYLEEIAESLNIEKLDNIPAIIFVTNNEILESNILDGVKNSKLKIEDFTNLLNIYEFSKVN